MPSPQMLSLSEKDHQKGVNHNIYQECRDDIHTLKSKMEKELNPKMQKNQNAKIQT